MATVDIQFKLQQHLNGLGLFRSEMEVIYLLAELRKLMEQEPELKVQYRSIKFYCDWALHTKKSFDFRGLEQVFAQIYSDCEDYYSKYPQVVEAKSIARLMYFEEFRKDLGPLFIKYELDQSMLEEHGKWVSFVKQLLGVLTDQPIERPSKEIASIQVVGSNSDSAAIMVIFTEPIIDKMGVGQPQYLLGNAY